MSSRAATISSSLSWFEKLFQLEENELIRNLHKNLKYENGKLFCIPNNKTYLVGTFTTPSVQDLRNELKKTSSSITKKLEFTHLPIGDILTLHAEKPKGIFQVASQFNCLEFPSPDGKPSDGITRYVFDRTQGPACSIACGPATLIRNYFTTNINDDKQINNLIELEETISETISSKLWFVNNGYVFSSEDLLIKFNDLLKNTPNLKTNLISKIRVGFHSQVQVVFRDRSYEPINNDEIIQVSQIFCSALSCAYTDVPTSYWKEFAQICLDGAYEATLLAAAIEKQKGFGSGDVYLTFLGGGVFGNEPIWIAHAIARAIFVCKHLDLKVFICHYREIDQEMKILINNEITRLEKSHF